MNLITSYEEKLEKVKKTLHAHMSDAMKSLFLTAAKSDPDKAIQKLEGLRHRSVQQQAKLNELSESNSSQKALRNESYIRFKELEEQGAKSYQVKAITRPERTKLATEIFKDQELMSTIKTHDKASFTSIKSLVDEHQVQLQLQKDATRATPSKGIDF